ncbi:MAG: glycosyltransferase [Bacillota bacterium]|nr:glycosyltransferase [Bacillota bacterium]
MRILQVIPHYVPAFRFGGALQVAHALGRALVARGHRVTVCCTSQADERCDLPVEVDTPVFLDGVEVYYERVRFLRRWGYSRSMGRRLPRLVADADAVLIHAHFQYANWAGARAARLAGKPYFVFPHGSLTAAALRASSQWLKRLYLGTLEKPNLLGAKHVIFNAEEECETSLYSERGVVIPNGVSPEEFAELTQWGAWRAAHPETIGRTVFLFLGRLDIRQKAADVIVASFAQLASERGDIMLVLAGPSEGGDLRVLQRLVNEHRIADRVLFQGLVSGIAKRQLLRDADVFLMPSRYEGLSIALLEAMASGLPVILSDQAGLHRQVARWGGGCVVQPSLDSVVPAMRRMLDPELRKTAGAAARELVLAEHLWPTIAGKVEALLGDSCDATATSSSQAMAEAE